MKKQKNKQLKVSKQIVFNKKSKKQTPSQSILCCRGLIGGLKTFIIAPIIDMDNKLCIYEACLNWVFQYLKKEKCKKSEKSKVWRLFTIGSQRKMPKTIPNLSQPFSFLFHFLIIFSHLKISTLKKLKISFPSS